MRKALVEKLVRQAIKGSEVPVADRTHTASEMLPFGVDPLTPEEDEYFFNRLVEETPKMKEWPTIVCI